MLLKTTDHEFKIDWDLKKMIKTQCQREGLNIPTYFNSWCNIKKTFKSFYGINVFGMDHMLSHLELTLKGRHHSGIDDCRNIAQVLIKMIRNKALINRNN